MWLYSASAGEYTEIYKKSITLSRVTKVVNKVNKPTRGGGR